MANIMSALISASLLCLLFNIGDLVNMASDAAPQNEGSGNTPEKSPGVSQPQHHGSAPPASEDAMGTVSKEEHPVCPPPTVHTVLEHDFARFVSNCTCECAEGKLGWYQNGTACFKLDLGYDNEMTPKHGKCYSGQCVLDYIPLGCNEEKHKNLSIPKNDYKGDPPVGCAYLCSALSEGEKSFHYELGYYPPGTSCRHVKNPGNYTDGPPREWTGTEYVNATCRKVLNRTLCLQDGEVPAC